MADTDFKYSPLLVGLTEDQVESLLATGEHRSYVDGTIIVEQNAPSDCLYILTGGAAQVEHRDGGRAVPLARFEQVGEFFGEMSLLDMMPRSADIRACGPTSVMAFPKQGLTAVFTAEPRLQMTLILNISRTLSLRLREADARIVELSGQG